MRKLLLLALLFLTVPVWAQAPAFRAEANGGNGAGTSVTITKPTGTAADDILIFCINKENNNAITWPSDFTEKQSIDLTTSFLAFAWKRAGGSEPANYSASWTGSAWRNALIAAYSGVITTGDPFDPATVSTFSDAASGTGITMSGITTTVADVLLIGMNGNLNDKTRTWAELTERADIRTVAIGDLAQTSSGASGDKSATLESADTNRMGMLGGLKPPAVGGVTRRRVVIY